MQPKKALTIAGSDSGGGAGIQADLKTFFAHGVYGMSVLTAITAQNTLKVSSVEVLSGKFILAQLEAIFEDLKPDAAKTGMLANKDIIETISEFIKKQNFTQLVVDPVMVSKSGHRLLEKSAEDALKQKLLPIALVATPNLFEAEVLLSRSVRNKEEMQEAAKALFDLGVRYPLIKGGHLSGMPAIDILYDGNTFYEWENERIPTKNTHGTGCTFSAAITANLAKGYSVFEAVGLAKNYITGAIRTAPEIGQGHGPVNHFFGTEIKI